VRGETRGEARRGGGGKGENETEEGGRGAGEVWGAGSERSKTGGGWEEFARTHTQTHTHALTVETASDMREGQISSQRDRHSKEEE